MTSCDPDVLIDAPDELDLTALKAHGLLATEKELPEGDAPGNQQQQAAGKPVELDEGVVMQLVSMGFDVEGCKRAVFNTNNQGTYVLAWYNYTPPTHYSPWLWTS